MSLLDKMNAQYHTYLPRGYNVIQAPYSYNDLEVVETQAEADHDYTHFVLYTVEMLNVMPYGVLESLKPKARQDLIAHIASYRAESINWSAESFLLVKCAEALTDDVMRIRKEQWNLSHRPMRLSVKNVFRRIRH